MLPDGIYAVSQSFDGKSGTVSFTFRGILYTAETGVNAFADFESGFAAADRAPSVPFHGKVYGTPVIIVPAGRYAFRSDRSQLKIEYYRSVTVLGENAGVSPNSECDISAKNPERSAEESELYGNMYFGIFAAVDGVDGGITLDGLKLYNCRIHDRRSGGGDMHITVKNCIIGGAFTTHWIFGRAISDGSERTVGISDCRIEDFNKMCGAGCMLAGCFTKLSIQRLYFANSKKFFGLSDYCYDVKNTVRGGSFEYLIKDSLFENCSSVHGISLSLPKDASGIFEIDGCSFKNFPACGDPNIMAKMPSENCRLVIKNSSFVSEGSAAAAVVSAGDGRTEFENTNFSGFSALYSKFPARRTEAPDFIGDFKVNAVVEDPHETDDGHDFVQLDALYADRSVFYGDMHTHTNSGGTSDGATPLGEFVKQLKALKVDFAAVVDHKQMRHFFLPEWDSSMLICGNEPGCTLTVDDPERPIEARRMDYVMIFAHSTDMYRVMEAFPEFKFSGGPDGHHTYPGFTPDRLAELARFIRGLGGMLSHAHPKQLMDSENPLDYYLTDAVNLETVMTDVRSYNTKQNIELWDTLLRLGKRIRTTGASDTHAEAKCCALTTVYAREKSPSSFLSEIRDGDCTAGQVGIKMTVNGAKMGSSLPYRDGLVLAVRVGDIFYNDFKENTVYGFKVYTDKGLAYYSEFNGKHPQKLALKVQPRKYYRVEITNESDGFTIAVSNPIWLDQR